MTVQLWTFLPSQCVYSKIGWHFRMHAFIVTRVHFIIYLTSIWVHKSLRGNKAVMQCPRLGILWTAFTRMANTLVCACVCVSIFLSGQTQWSFGIVREHSYGILQMPNPIYSNYCINTFQNGAFILWLPNSHSSSMLLPKAEIWYKWNPEHFNDWGVWKWSSSATSKEN